MRIEAYNQVAQIYKSNKIAGTAKTAKAGAARDEVQISSFGQDYQIAKQAVAEASDIREDKVAEVAAKVNSGNYDVSVDDFADKLLAKYRSFML
jgi:negative regulator of flagellin synthesis FlgM